MRAPLTEEEARETKPEFRVERPATASVEDPEIAPPTVREFAELMKVERLPLVLYMSRMLAVCPATGLIAKVVVAVDVPVMEKTEYGELEAIETRPSLVTAKYVEDAAEEYPLPVKMPKAKPGVELETMVSFASEVEVPMVN